MNKVLANCAIIAQVYKERQETDAQDNDRAVHYLGLGSHQEVHDMIRESGFSSGST